jgi:effector-binding domain-containing protein
VAYALHVGPYAEIARAYQALTLWMQEHGHESAGAPRESYLVGPGHVPDPAEYAARSSGRSAPKMCL